jgi:hypothetical protein
MKRPAKNPGKQTDGKVEHAAAQPEPPAPTPEQIRRRAQEIFEARGSAPGRELDDWLQAEIELKSGMKLRGRNTAN